MSPSKPLNVRKKQRRHYSGKKKRHTQKAQVIVDQKSQKIVATAFGNGKLNDFQMLKASRSVLSTHIYSLADTTLNSALKSDLCKRSILVKT